MSEDIAWAAGLFEGEGSIYAAGTRSQRVRRPALQLVTTDRDVIERFALIVPHGHLGRQAAQRGQNKPLYAWRCQTFAGAEAVMNLLLPHLGERRRRRWYELRDQYIRAKEDRRVFCSVCGVSFESSRPTLALYCSPSCKFKAARARQKEAA